MKHCDRRAVPVGIAVAWILLFWLAAGHCNATHAIEPDGVLSPGEWDSATHVEDFRVTQPFTGEQPASPVQAWIRAAPEGLGIALRVHMLPGTARSRQPVQHDFTAKVDRVNISIDFEAAGRTAYNFYLASTGTAGDAVITNENVFSYGWDGSWRHGVQEDDEGWIAEVLIPWHTAPMSAATDGRRKVRVYLDRVIASTGERAAWPSASLERSRFLSEFSELEIAAYERPLLAVTPYVSLLDQAGDRVRLRAGTDIQWKPNPSFHLIGTFLPDFGQVESDNLVVNFSAIETFVKDKRPFFTENQSFFDFTTPSDASQMLYTRRLGARADDGGGSSDLRVAAKGFGSFGPFSMGALYADETGSAGRTFGVLRATHDFGGQSLGAMATIVERPFLDRSAVVMGVDHDLRFGKGARVLTRLLRSDVSTGNADVSGIGATVLADYDVNHAWRHQLVLMHFGNDFQINDAGYLARNDLSYAHWQTAYRRSHFRDASPYASMLWRWRLTEAQNTQGDRVQGQLRINRQSSLRDGSTEVLQLNLNAANFDDLLLRGNGVFARPSSFDLYGEYATRRKGSLALRGFANAISGGLAGNDKVGARVGAEPTLFFGDALDVSAQLSYGYEPDALVWQGRRDAGRRDTIGRFKQRTLQLDAGLDWNIDTRRELRIRLQALALDSRHRQTVQVLPDRTIIPSSVDAADFTVRNLGFQVRYRQRIAPMSDLYVVYARGGYDERGAMQPLGEIFGDVFQLRDDEQFLVKLSYRLER